MRLVALFLLVSTASAAHNLHKRSNGYGDELIVPEETRVEVQTGPKQQYAEEEVSVVDAAPSSGYEDQHAQTVEVERSGYRFKRSNGYGDELIVPEVKAVVNAGQKSYGEEEVSVVHSEPYEDTQAHPILNAIPVQESGYRLKRNVRTVRGNEYGDEQIVPEVTIEDTHSARADYAETAPVVAEVQQYEPVPASEAVEQVVEHSGYRTKRNAYGDELIVPTTVLQTAPVAPVSEIAAPVVEQSYVGQVVAARPAISPTAVRVVQTVPEHYVLSKQSVSYGDEAVVPAQVPVIPVQHFRYAEIPLTYGSLYSAQPYPKAPMVVASGYRTAKRAREAKRRLH